MGLALVLGSVSHNPGLVVVLSLVVVYSPGLTLVVGLV